MSRADVPYTDLQLEIIGVMSVYVRMTTRQIAEKLERNPRAIATAMTHLRGHGVVSDGSTATRIPVTTMSTGRTAYAYAHTPPARPIVWTLEPQREWRQP